MEKLKAVFTDARPSAAHARVHFEAGLPIRVPVRAERKRARRLITTTIVVALARYQSLADTIVQLFLLRGPGGIASSRPIQSGALRKSSSERKRVPGQRLSDVANATDA